MPEVNYLWDPIEDNVIAELDEGGAVVAEYTTEPEQYGNVVSQHRDGETNCFYSDGLGSTTEVTDTAGDSIATRAYCAFGEATEVSGDLVFPFQFVGQKGYYFDISTEDYLVRRRSYRPEIGRWLSTDPLNRMTQDYRYAYSRPTIAIDPSGLIACVAVDEGKCCITDFALITKLADVPKDVTNVTFTNPSGVTDYDLNKPMPVWKEDTGHAYNVHWVVVTGKNLEDCRFSRFFAATWTLNGGNIRPAKLTNEAYEENGKGVHPIIKDLDDGMDGIHPREYYPENKKGNWDKTTFVVIADAPGYIGGLAEGDRLSLKWNFLIQAQSKTVPAGGGSMRDNVAGLMWYDVIIEATYVSRTFQPVGAAKSPINSATLINRYSIKDYNAKYCKKETETKGSADSPM